MHNFRIFGAFLTLLFAVVVDGDVAVVEVSAEFLDDDDAVITEVV